MNRLLWYWISLHSFTVHSIARVLALGISWLKAVRCPNCCRDVLQILSMFSPNSFHHLCFNTGDTLVMEVEVTKFNKKFGIIKATGKGFTDGTLAVEVGEMTFALAKPE